VKNGNFNDYYYLPTDPGNIFLAKHIDCGNVATLAEQHSDEENFAILTHLGNWWGELKSSDIPTPYGDPSPMKWGVEELIPYHVGGWKFATVVRDGRNQVESTLMKKSGIEEEHYREDPVDYFCALCKGWRNKARVILDCKKVWGDDYHIEYFEDLMEDPAASVSNILSLNDFTVDRDIVEARARDLKESFIEKGFHSSFNDTTGLNERWHSWTEDQIDIFQAVAGRELGELGYVW
jgi:hypothetical protein